MLRLFSIWTSIFFLAASFSLKAQDNNEYRVTKLPAPITFDGVLDEDAWQLLEPLEHGVYLPTYGGTAKVNSEFFLTYDDKYIYLGGNLYADSADISDTGKSRDLFKPNNDYYGLILDTFNDNENGLAFFTSPSGLRLDFTIFNDAQGQFPINTTWNTFWDARTTKSDKGWFTEIRVPFSSLRFQEDNGNVTMGFITWRWIPSLTEEHIYPMVPNDLGEWSSMKPSSGKKIVFEGVYSQKPAYFTPYLLTGIERENELNDAESSYIESVSPKLNAGFDFKYGITSNLTMDLTLNPDFAQVEVDDQQVNLTRFSLFFPEKRLFFQERASIFSFNMGGPNTIFYSRRIGLNDDEIVPIYGGVRLNGRVGSWDLGFLDMQTAKKDSLASTNYGVLRLRKQIINSNSYVGAMVANQIDVNGQYNTAAGLDGIFKLYQDHFMTLNFAQTYENNGVKSILETDHSKFRGTLVRRSNRGFGYDFSYSYAGGRYNPAMGFEIREDYTRFGDRIWWGWIPGENSRLITHQMYALGTIWKNNEDWTTGSSNYGFGWKFQSKNNWGGDFSVQEFEEGIDESFDIGNAEIPVGRYTFRGLTTLLNTPWSNPLSLVFNSYTGSFYDGKALTLGFSPIWSPSPSFELQLRYEYNAGTFDDRNESYSIHLGSFKATYMFSTALSASLYVQYNNDSDEVVTNFRLRYNPREGNDLYIVYNDNMNTQRHTELLTLPLYSVQALAIKYTYTFTWVR